jgi:hypothetical protein
MVTAEQIREIMVKELPDILENTPEIHQFFVNQSRRHFADKTRTDDRFDRLLDEMRQEREEQKRKWDDLQVTQRQEREEQKRKWDDLQVSQRQEREEQKRKWDDLQVTQRQEREEQKRKWDDLQVSLQKEREEQKKKWEANQQVITEMLTDIRALSRKHDTTIGSLGARWGLHTEQSFRNALKGILEEFAGVQVLNVTEYDDAGIVFGKPDQIELDIIIKNGVLIIAEIKSSISKSEMYTFEKKVRFYEERHQRKVTEIIVISPMVSPNAIPIAEKLGIKIYSSAADVPL